jgi:hypothetical protein
MKISASTLNVLKNFASINTNILIREGNVLRTLSDGTSIFAVATVEEEFPKEFAVYDLNSLLSILSITDDQDIEFGEVSLLVSKNGGEFEYFYSEPTMILSAPDKTIPVEEFYSFVLTSQDIMTIMKASAIVAAPVMSIIGKKGKASVVVSDPKNATSNTYTKNLPNTDLTFSCAVAVDRLKIIPENYDVTVNNKFIHLKSQARDLQYWIVTNVATSK